MIEQPTFGERLRKRRLELGLSQKDLADGFVTPSYVSLLEHGNRVPSLDVVIRMAALLQTTPQELVGGNIAGLANPAAEPSAGQLAARWGLRPAGEPGENPAGARGRLTERLEQLRDRPEAEEEFLAVGIQLLGVLHGGGELEQWLELCHELRELPTAKASADIRLLLAFELASTLRELNQLPAAGRVCEEALAESATPGSPDHVRLLALQTSIQCGLEDFAGAEATLIRMLEMAESNGHVGALGNAHWTASMAYSRMGRNQDAYDQLAEARKTLDMGSMQVREWLRFCRFTASILIEDARDLPAARRWIDVAATTAELAELASDVRSALRERGHYDLAAGDAAAAAEAFKELIDADQGAVDGESVVAFEGLSRALEQQGRTEEAMEWLRRAADFYEADANFRKAAEMWRRVDTIRQSQHAA